MNRRENIATCRLAPREIQVLALMAQGCDNRGIARRLFVSEWTVRNWARRIFDKLGASNRAHCVHIAHQLGIAGVVEASPNTRIWLEVRLANSRAGDGEPEVRDQGGPGQTVPDMAAAGRG